jgi:hypothetical protein
VLLDGREDALRLRAGIHDDAVSLFRADDEIAVRG